MIIVATCRDFWNTVVRFEFKTSITRFTLVVTVIVAAASLRGTVVTVTNVVNAAQSIVGHMMIIATFQNFQFAVFTLHLISGVTSLAFMGAVVVTMHRVLR